MPPKLASKYRAPRDRGDVGGDGDAGSTPKKAHSYVLIRLTTPRGIYSTGSAGGSVSAGGRPDIDELLSKLRDAIPAFPPNAMQAMLRMPYAVKSRYASATGWQRTSRKW